MKYIWNILIITLTAGLAMTRAETAEPIPFATNGGLKMLYDNRMYPQAVTSDGALFLVWRGDEGFPYIRSYNLADRTFSKPHMLLTDLDIEIDKDKYRRDHHYAPVLWTGASGRLHVLFGCHGKAGVHLVSRRPGDITAWVQGSEVAHSISYPKFHRIHGGRTLVYYRHKGHLGEWRFRISPDGGQTWDSPAQTAVNMNAEPRTAAFAAHAGSYNTTRVSADGKTLHVAFIWKMEEPLRNTRYQLILHDHVRRHNLYYFRIDLLTGKATNHAGKAIQLPVTKTTADRDLIVWDTEERSAAVGPSIHLDANGQPSLLLPVSDKTPYAGSYYFVRSNGATWKKTEITRTAHPFHASYLDRFPDGRFRAVLIQGGGHTDSEQNNLDQYGWGDAVNIWTSDPAGENWQPTRDLTPVPGHKYQNVQFVSQDLATHAPSLLLFYGWKDKSGSATGYLWDNR